MSFWVVPGRDELARKESHRNGSPGSVDAACSPGSPSQRPALREGVGDVVSSNGLQPMSGGLHLVASSS